MDTIEIFQRLGTAIAIGAVVGVERHWRERNEDDGQRTAGLRTFTLIGMFGGVAGLIVDILAQNQMAVAILLAGFFVPFALIFAAFEYREAVAEENYSVTTTVAAMLTFALGVLAVKGDLTLASAAGVTMAAILASRDILHGFMRRLSWTELRSAIVLLGMTFVVLPLLPDRPIGPFGGISPARTWLLAVILAAISFCGYILVRLLGAARGELLAGVVAGLASSTGATLNNARRAGAGEDARILAAGALGACAVSYLRTALLVALLAAPIAYLLIPALVAATLSMTVIAVVLARHEPSVHAAQPSKNPFDLDAVLKMAALLAAVAFVARAASQWFGDSGLIAVSALSGLVDVDAAVVTVAGMLETIALPSAVVAIAVAVISNTIAKAIYAAAAGSAGFGSRFVAASLVTLGIAGATYWIQVAAFG